MIVLLSFVAWPVVDFLSLSLPLSLSLSLTTHIPAVPCLPQVSCLTPAALAAAFGFNLPLSAPEFEVVSVGLIAMLDADACVEESSTTSSSTSLSKGEQWGYSEFCCFCHCCYYLPFIALVFV